MSHAQIREVNHMKDLLDLLCWLTPFFYLYWHFLIKIYFESTELPNAVEAEGKGLYSDSSNEQR